MVVLACTHFPLVEEELRTAFGPGVQFVHGAAGIARRIAALTVASGSKRRRTEPDPHVHHRKRPSGGAVPPLPPGAWSRLPPSDLRHIKVVVALIGN